jgi:hypothetical protein
MFSGAGISCEQSKAFSGALEAEEEENFENAVIVEA